MSARVALVPRPRSSISSISLPCEIRDGGWVSLPTIHGFASGLALGAELRHRGELQRLALLQRRDLLVGGAGVGVDRGEPGIDDDRAADEVGLRAASMSARVDSLIIGGLKVARKRRTTSS